MNILCPHFTSCSGCQFDVSVDLIPLFAEAKEFLFHKGIQIPPLRVGEVRGWRTRAKLAVRGIYLDPKIGLFEEGSHRVIDIPHCRVHHPSINHIVEKIKMWIGRNGISIYNEKEGLLRYIQCSVETSTGKVQVVLVVNGDWKKLPLEELYEEENELLHSLWVNVNTRTDNVILGETWVHIAGEMDLWEELSGRQICFHPACFCQGNLEMYGSLIESLRKLVPPDSVVVELYAGVGSIGLCLVDIAKKIDCVEVTPESCESFVKSRNKLPDAEKEKIFLKISPADEADELLEKAQVLVVDPPRKGISRALVEKIGRNSSLEKIIYVSCGWSSFKRDCEALQEVGWAIETAEAFLFFPGTNHIELLSSFVRRR